MQGLLVAAYISAKVFRDYGMPSSSTSAFVGQRARFEHQRSISVAGRGDWFKVPVVHRVSDHVLFPGKRFVIRLQGTWRLDPRYSRSSRLVPECRLTNDQGADIMVAVYPSSEGNFYLESKHIIHLWAQNVTRLNTDARQLAGRGWHGVSASVVLPSQGYFRAALRGRASYLVATGVLFDFGRKTTNLANDRASLDLILLSAIPWSQRSRDHSSRHSDTPSGSKSLLLGKLSETIAHSRAGLPGRWTMVDPGWLSGPPIPKRIQLPYAMPQERSEWRTETVSQVEQHQHCQFDVHL